MLTVHMLLPPTPSLLLDHDAHGLRLRAQHHRPTFVQPLVDIRLPLEREIPAAQRARPVQSQDVSRDDARHLERQSDAVARCDEVGSPVDVDGDVFCRLGDEEREEVADGGIEGGGR